MSRILLENAVRHLGSGATNEDVQAILDRNRVEIPFFPSRVILQDFTGVPCVADLAAIRDEVARNGGDPSSVNPRIAADLVIDHSVIVDAFGTPLAFEHNVGLEYERNLERYTFLRWAQDAFTNLRIVPPGAGIVHQVNLEFLAPVVASSGGVAFPDTLVGTDSHTTMIGGLGVAGWGVGGIEAEAAMLGYPLPMIVPEVVGVRLSGSMPEGSTATDLVLMVTELLRSHGVVNKFVEFFGPGLSSLSVADRATIANMSPEYGATEGIFPVDEQTLNYLRSTGRSDEIVERVEAYYRAQEMFVDASFKEPDYDELLTFDLGKVTPSVAGPRRPQDRVILADVPAVFSREILEVREPVSIQTSGKPASVGDGSVVIAAITSCTNTSNPTVMIAAGLVARKAVELGMQVPAHVKTSLAPGSPVVADYLNKSGLTTPLEKLGFHVVGFGCTTCIGNSGPLPDEVAQAVDDESLQVVAVLSGNRNFEGRIHPQVRHSFLASPPLVVAYALAGHVDINLTSAPVGVSSAGAPVFLKDLWPTQAEINSVIEACISPDDYRKRGKQIFGGDERWNALQTPTGQLYDWQPDSTYIQPPPFAIADQESGSIRGAKLLALLGDSVTTDHISPAGAIPLKSEAGAFLSARGVEPRALHSYGARRGNHHVMLRGTFANIRLRNKLCEPTQGGYTKHFPSREEMSIFAAAERYRADGVPLIVVAGKEYGSGSSRDWAAKGTMLLGVRAVLAESFERIHRTNLAQMGVLPLQLLATVDELDLNGDETFDIEIPTDLKPGQMLQVAVCGHSAGLRNIECKLRLDGPTDVQAWRAGGILPRMTKQLSEVK